MSGEGARWRGLLVAAACLAAAGLASCSSGGGDSPGPPASRNDGGDPPAGPGSDAAGPAPARDLAGPPPVGGPADSGPLPGMPPPPLGDGGAAGEVAAGDRGAAPPPLPPATDGGLPDGALPPAPDAGPPLGEFPLAAVRAARPERLVSVATPCEGPSWRDGEVFFGFRDGLMRISADRKLFRYIPELAFSVGSYQLADGSLLVCDRAHKLVQVRRDGKVAVLADDSASNANDVTVDGQGNVFFSDFRTAIFRITPDGQVSRALANLVSPNGVEVDPESRYLYFISGPRVQRTLLPRAAGGPFGPIETVVSLEASGDGCAFDAWGNLWVAVHDPGRLAIVDVSRRQVITSIGAGGTSVTNLTFGGPGRDEVFTTVSSNGVFRIPVGARGFAGHPGAPRYTPKRMLDIQPANQPVP